MTWQRVRLKDLGDWYGGGTPSKSRPEFWADGSVPWLSPKDMGPEILHSTRDTVTADAVSGSSVRLVPSHSVAVVVRSGILERKLPVAQVPFATTLNQDMKAVVPRPGIDSRWVAWGLRAFEQQLLRETRKSGTTVASIEMQRFYSFELPLPPLDEQRHIVDLLENHLSRLYAADRAVTYSLRRLDRLRDAALAKAIGNAQADPSTRLVRLGELARISTGTTPLRANAAFYKNGTVPWITSGDLHQGLIAHSSQFVTELALAETSLKLIPPGSLLVAMYGEGRTRGTAAELGIEATTNQACASITLHEPDLRPWVRLVLDASYNSMRRIAAGGVQPNLNLSLVRSIEVPVPNPAVRNAAIAQVAVVTDTRAQIAPSLASASRRGTALRRSLLAAAFAGELTDRANGANGDSNAL